MEIEDEKLLLTSLEDISYLKEIESNLRSSQKQFKEAFNRAEFYKDIFAHDMNNILQNILSSLELNSLAVKENNKYQILNETYNVIKNQIKRGATLISNVRKLSEIEENDINLFKLNLLDYLEKSIKDVREIYNNKNLKLELNSFDHQIVVLANELIVDIFENLFQNAIHHNENEAKEIIINVKEVSDTKANKDFVQIEFIDNGKGIEDKRKINIFERATNGAKGVRGMGLGLSLVKKIIEIYGGEICVEDRVKNDFKKGSKFIMTLPMHLGQ
ncbi:MAG: HAMP domain-containing sensor histidine kinase [Candidatus Lokiarchaeota archaeon]